jgi:hypothetical protein
VSKRQEQVSDFWLAEEIGMEEKDERKGKQGWSIWKDKLRESLCLHEEKGVPE